MGLTVILRGFKVPIAVLDRFLASNGVEETNGTPPRLFYLPGECTTDHARSTYGYVAYAYIMVYSQRMIDHPRDLPEQAPPSFAELRREILGFLQVRGVQGAEGKVGANLLFIVVTDEREFPLEGTFMRQLPKSDLRCNCCTAIFDYWFDLLYHTRGTRIA
ncbi:hypothetical protein C7999DRAFT_33923 [Corynascus novoguineensis]|uniref:Uncharacterized protein n=1 Tax=Corynascus novoguineensis TaxID=1126955 RepID=A0AAN7CRW1_9PEZI|nr:hypothetical protein C7999DRAFT_33923 [Corynascus novoguineensis]